MITLKSMNATSYQKVTNDNIRHKKSFHIYMKKLSFIVSSLYIIFCFVFYPIEFIERKNYMYIYIMRGEYKIYQNFHF